MRDAADYLILFGVLIVAVFLGIPKAFIEYLNYRRRQQ